VPDLIREAYADRLDEPAVRETVREVETAFVPSGERSYPPDATPEEVGERDDASTGRDDRSADTDRGDETARIDGEDGSLAGIGEATSDAEGSTDRPTESNLSEAARRLAERDRSGDERG
jgi:hypothetical protein